MSIKKTVNRLGLPDFIQTTDEISKALLQEADRKRYWLSFFQTAYFSAVQFEGLPPTLLSRQLASALWYFPAVALFKARKSDENPMLGTFVPVDFNEYMEPAHARMILLNSGAKVPGFSPDRVYNVNAIDPDQEAVCMTLLPSTLAISTGGYADPRSGLGTSLAQKFDYYADTLALLDCLKRVNIIANAHTVMITADGLGDQNANELKRMLYSMVPILLANKGVDWKGMINAISLGSPWLAKDIDDAEQALKSEAYTLLGIGHVSFEKTERLNIPETQKNDAANEAFFGGVKVMLQEALDQVKKVFGQTWTLKEQEEGEDADTETDSGVAGPGEQVGDIDPAGSPKPTGE